MSASPSENLPFHLRGNFAPVSAEITATDLRVEGTIPRELSGLYVRNGANPHTGKSDHWFIGDGMLHGVRLDGGRASWYRNRYVKTPFLSDPKTQRRNEVGQADRTASVANTHVIQHAGQILALEEGSFPYVVDGELETLGLQNYDGKLTTAFTAHPKICPVTGELLFFGYDQMPPYLTYHRVSPDGKLVQSEEIEVGGPTMMHDFAITEKHAIFFDLPVVFSIEAALAGSMPFMWSDDYPARFGVMPRQGSNADVQWFTVDSCYVFHSLNAYDDGDETVLDVCRSSEMWRQAGDMSGGGSDDNPGGELTFHRFRFNRATGAVNESTIDRRSMEFPRVADAVVGQPYRYGFMVRMAGGEDDSGVNMGGTAKADLKTGTVVEHNYGAGRSSGEPVFVPAEGSDPAGDEGWVMSYVYDQNRNSSDLVIVDAQDFEKEVAKVQLPQRIPFGFHGSYIPD